MNVYIDESGNTGDNLIDENQKFFTLAGVGVTQKQINILQEELLEIFKDRKSENELKTRDIIGGKWEPKLIDTFNLLMEHKFLPFILFIEKKYMIAGKIVENFFDPVYNNKTNNQWTHPLIIKDKVANYFYDNLSDDTINKAATAFRECDKSKVNEVYQLIKHNIEEGCNIEEVKLLTGVENHLDSLCEDMKGAELSFKQDIGKGGVLNSPNYTSFLVLLEKIDGYFSCVNKSVSIIFDSASQYNEAYIKLFNTLAKTPREIIETEKGNIIFGIENVKEFSVATFEDDSGVQLADILATSVQHIMQKIILDDGTQSFTEFENFMTVLIYRFFDLNCMSCVMSHSSFMKYHKRVDSLAKSLNNNKIKVP